MSKLPLEQQTLVVRSALNKQHRYVVITDGTRVDIPTNWELLPPGDAAITKELKKIGPTWTAQQKKGRKTFSDGVWAAQDNIAQAKSTIKLKRSTPEYTKKRTSELKRREVKQTKYVDEFHNAVLMYLSFHSCHKVLAEQMAELITTHATPVGSGTVARTETIPIEQRAAAAVTAWMRHQTTEYDRMRIKRVQGERREVRKELAKETRELLSTYRKGLPIDEQRCPLFQAINRDVNNQS